VNHVTVFERPGLHEFLKKTSEFADLILFTAGLEGTFAGWMLPFFCICLSHEPINSTSHSHKTSANFSSGYARPLVDRIDAHNRFKLRLYRPSTVTT
jgi:RNA polymerase II subunit A small phosphatase-like protein